MASGAGRGWGSVAALTLAALTLAVGNPVLSVLTPLSLLLLALPPRRPGLIALGAALVVFLFWGPRSDPLWYAERGWALLLGGWFVGAVVLRPSAGFLSRALLALGGTLATAAAVLPLSGGWDVIDWTVARQFRLAASTLASVWGAAADAEPIAGRFADGIYRAADIQALLYPALLSLSSLASLAVAWWLYRRLTDADEAPLRTLREFRFRDELVWAVVIGIALVVLPVGPAVQRAGLNVLTFMGTLYALRGLAVALATTGVPGIAAALFGLVALLILPVVLLAAALVGLADTWIDLRSRRAAAGSHS